MDELQTERCFLLVKRGLYYRPNNNGYTGIKEKAGRYQETDASPEGGVTAIHESLAPEYAPGCFPDLASAHFAERVGSLAAAFNALLAGQVEIPSNQDTPL